MGVGAEKVGRMDREPTTVGLRGDDKDPTSFLTGRRGITGFEDHLHILEG